MLRLSRHVMPQVRMGSQLLTPQNMAGGEERLGYLLGLVEHLNRLGRDEGIEMDDIARFLDGTPFGRMLTALEVRGGQLQARLREDAADFVRFDPDRLAVVFADGRRRRAEEMTTIETGRRPPSSAPGRGAASGLPRSALAVRCAASAIELDEDFVEGLIEREVIERVPEGMTGAAAVDHASMWARGTISPGSDTRRRSFSRAARRCGSIPICIRCCAGSRGRRRSPSPSTLPSRSCSRTMARRAGS